jgi:protein ImuB
VATVVDRIANDIGPENVWRPSPFASHVPERAVVREPPFHKAPPWERDPTQPRPIRLLKRPEPIDVTAPVPDDPPILFRWRKRVHRIRAATGPERIAAEWWRARKRQAEREESDLLRDYYQVEDTDGARFWVFRAGLHGSEAHTPRWFLHGLFG